MEEEASSWIRRTKFSHTVYHPLRSLNVASAPLAIERDRVSGLKSRPQPTTSIQPATSSRRDVDKKPVFVSSQIQRNPITNKHRSLSPTLNTVHSDVFKEARSDRKRFSTPNPQTKWSEKGVKFKSLHRDPPAAKVSNSMLSPSNSSPLRHLASMKAYNKSKRKESAWTKYFDHGGGKVNAVEMSEEWTLDLSELMLGFKFAHGAHSRLYHGVYKDEPVAVKMVTVPDDDEDGKLAAQLEKQFNREVTHLTSLQHANVLKLMAACRHPPAYFVVTEYLSEGSLRAYLHRLEHKALPLKKLIAMALDIAHGMEYIHSRGVIHRDLKPENILINENLQLKIADFGIACEEIYCDPLADDPGTYRWMAPEMIKHKSYGRKVDVYSFGLILWEMVTGRIPYEDMTPIQAAFAVVDKNIRPVVPGDCAPAMRALIEQCWSSKADKRPEFWQIVKVLEQFDTSLAHDGTLNLVQNPYFQDQKKGLLHWIQKLNPVHPDGSSSLKPKFS